MTTISSEQYLITLDFDINFNLIKQYYMKKSNYLALSHQYEALIDTLNNIESVYNVRIRKHQNKVEELNIEILAYINMEGVDLTTEELNTIKKHLMQEQTKIHIQNDINRNAKQNGQTKNSKKEKEMLISLFKKLVKMYHPDLVLNKKDKEYREAIMKTINMAYKEGDISVLLDIEKKGRSTVCELYKSESLKIQIDLVDSQIKDIKKKITTLKRSKFYKWKLKIDYATRTGANFFEDTENFLIKKIEKIEKKIKDLKNKSKTVPTLVYS